MKLLLVGMNHRSAPVEMRERFAIDDPAPALEKLVAGDEIEEAVLISTCNRVEIVVQTPNVEAARHRLVRFFGTEWPAGPQGSGGSEWATRTHGAAIEDHLYVYRDAEAIAHVFRVASAIDSMVVGEPQILGQVKDAYRHAVDAGSCGPILSRLFQRAFATAKRVRSETRIGHGAVSMARIGVDLVAQVFEDLGSKKALLVGAGEMVEAALAALQGNGLGHATIANRSLERARDLAERFGVTAFGLDALPRLLAEADVVLTSVAVAEPILGVELAREVLARRRGRPVVVIDLGVPRNVAPEVGEIDNVYLYDVDDLQGIASQNAEERQREVARAGRIVSAECQRFEGWLGALEALPTIRDLSARAEALRHAEFERSVARLDLDEEQRAGLETMTRSLVSKLLHHPLTRLRKESDRAEGLALRGAARVLFGLDEPEAGADSEALDDPADDT